MLESVSETQPQLASLPIIDGSRFGLGDMSEVLRQAENKRRLMDAGDCILVLNRAGYHVVYEPSPVENQTGTFSVSSVSQTADYNRSNPNIIGIIYKALNSTEDLV